MISPNMPAVSVAVTVLNERDDIDALVESLMQQTLAPAEVIIVDGGSTDGTWERLESASAKHPTLVPIRDESCSLQRSAGPIARGRNVGIAAACDRPCRTLQTATFIADRDQGWMFCAGGFESFPGSVGGAAVDDDDFGGSERLLHQALDQGVDVVALVEDGYGDAHGWHVWRNHSAK